MHEDLIHLADRGLYCPRGDFYIDPWSAVEKAVVTHAHADHARWGCAQYLISAEGASVFRARLGAAACLQTMTYGETCTIGDVSVSFHPAGHILGSAQIRVEYRGEVWVVSGDYKTQADPTCSPHEVVPCHVLITESTFGLPVYRWPDRAAVMDSIHQWWRENREAGMTSVLFAYALGKAQSILAGLDLSIGPVYTHAAVERLVAAYREQGVTLPPTILADRNLRLKGSEGALVIAPPSALGSPWMRRFSPYSTAMASGWMLVRGHRRRRAVDRGFVLSDHVDWPALISVVQATGAERVGVTHGYSDVLARFLREQGREAWVINTRFSGDQEEAEGGAEPHAEDLT